jgi:LysM repeat protein
VLLALLPGCANDQYRELSYKNNDPFYQKDKDNGYSGQKRLLDRVYQLDPGQRLLKYSPDFLQNPPKKVALLPFENLQGGDFMLNGAPFTERKGEEKEAWSWTYSNRVRRFLFAHLSLREFEMVGLLETDAILKELGINCPERLYKVDPKDLGKALGVDAVVYGKVTHYGAHYYLLFTQVVVGLYVRCVSTHDGSTLFEVGEVRRDNNIRVATNPIDFAAGSLQNVITLRDLYVAKAADEVCREIVARIPEVESLKEEKELKWKTQVASSQKIQGIKTRLAMVNNDKDGPPPVELGTYLTDGGGGDGKGTLQRPPTIHKVQKGDTLFHLARKYYNDNSRWRTILEANRSNLQDKDRLVPGQTLVIP